MDNQVFSAEPIGVEPVIAAETMTAPDGGESMAMAEAFITGKEPADAILTQVKTEGVDAAFETLAQKAPEKMPEENGDMEEITDPLASLNGKGAERTDIAKEKKETANDVVTDRQNKIQEIQQHIKGNALAKLSKMQAKDVQQALKSLSRDDLELFLMMLLKELEKEKEKKDVQNNIAARLVRLIVGIIRDFFLSDAQKKMLKQSIMPKGV